MRVVRTHLIISPLAGAAIEDRHLWRCPTMETNRNTGARQWEQAFFAPPQAQAPADEARVLAFAAALQAHLGTVVTACLFAPAGREKDSAFPCALVTVEPYSPGGLRRLALNARSQLVIEAAEEYENGCRLPSGKTIAAALELGEAMLYSATWPIDDGFDLMPRVSWDTALGLICGPSRAFAWPVPHDTASVMPRHGDRVLSSALEVISVWPKRVTQSKTRPLRGDPSQTFTETFHVGDRWMLREEKLRLEWAELRRVASIGIGADVEAAHSGGASGNGPASKSRAASMLAAGRTLSLRRLSSSAAIPRRRPSAATLPSGRAIGTSAPAATMPAELIPPSITIDSCALATHAPELPVLALADELRMRGVPRASAVPAAAAALLQRDPLFCLSLFFGVPLLDRTRTLHGALRTVAASPLPPSRSETDAYRRRIFAGVPGWDAVAASWQSIEGGQAGTIIGGAPVSEVCARELDAAMMERARSLWEEADGASPAAEIRVMWSGGIDSTAALVSLLRAASEGGEAAARRRLERLVIVLDDDSRAEYPRFYRESIAGRLREEPRDGRSVSAIGGGGSGLIVTGELGDQLFGSDMCARAFAGGRDGVEECSRPGAAPTERPNAAHHFAAGLAAPWRETMLPALGELGLLPGGDATAWEEWIAPQLVKAPFPIVTTHDILWWLNFSCKWQIVTLRCVHDGGAPLAPSISGGKSLAQSPREYGSKGGSGGGGGSNGGGCGVKWADDVSTSLWVPQSVNEGSAVAPPPAHDGSLLRGVRHFYEARHLELWACVAEFHCRKFGAIEEWCSYKQPLKAFIRAFNGDDEYFTNKQKVASLNFGVGGERQDADHVRATLGLLCRDREDDGGTSTGGQLAAAGMQPVRYLRWGASSFREGTGLRALLRANFVASVRGSGTGAPHELTVNPWRALATVSAAAATGHGASTFNPVTATTLVGKSLAHDLITIGPVDAFECRAPSFASTDERQRRTFNPVTATTLVGKCAALLPPSLVQGRTVLDLGACLGAMCHWALCSGAVRAVAVEVQPDFCERAADMLAAASHTWPAVEGVEREERYAVAQAGVREFLGGCADDSFDVVVGAGLLHCFVVRRRP